MGSVEMNNDPTWVMDQKLHSDNFYNIIADTPNFRARPPLFCPIDTAWQNQYTEVLEQNKRKTSMEFT